MHLSRVSGDPRQPRKIVVLDNWVLVCTVRVPLYANVALSSAYVEVAYVRRPWWFTGWLATKVNRLDLVVQAKWFLRTIRPNGWRWWLVTLGGKTVHPFDSVVDVGTWRPPLSLRAIDFTGP